MILDLGVVIVVLAPSLAHAFSLYFQWTVCGQNGVNGQHVGQSAPTGGEESAAHRLRRTAARTARAWCFNPRTVPTACACRVSTGPTPFFHGSLFTQHYNPFEKSIKLRFSLCNFSFPCFLLFFSTSNNKADLWILDVG